ncbi:MAG: hypothetical protein HKP32_07425 [Woeseia sp.]|nr:hypothetical protein [Woeseia sp.]
MKHRIISIVALLCLTLLSFAARAEQFEAVYSLEGTNSSEATAAFEDLFSDPALNGSKVTLYAADFGVGVGSHKVVVDYSSYDNRAQRDNMRRESHGWARYLLAMQDAEFLDANMASVVADYGQPRHTAGYLIAYMLEVRDPAAYVAAMAELNKAAGNPGVLRIVAMRSGSRAVTHAVLIGGDNFSAVQKYMDKLFASDAFGDFAEKVSDIRSVVRIESYRRLGAWGY